jgi:hypothetical protein
VFGYAATRDGTPVPGDDAAARSPDPSPSATPRALPTRCAIERLPVPNGQRASLVTGADPSGRFVLGASEQSGLRKQVIVWDNGVPQVVTVPGEDQALYAVNSAGIAVGSSYQGSTHRSWLYRDGKLTALPGSPAAHAQAVGETGILAGSRRLSETATVPVKWATPDSRPVDLQVPAGWTGTGSVVGADGTVLGVLEQGRPNTQTGYVWAPEGTGRPIVAPAAGAGERRWFAPKSISGRSVIGAVYSETARDLSFTPAVYDLDTQQFAPIARRDALLVSPAGWGVTEKIIGKAVNGGPLPQRQLMLVSAAQELLLPYLHAIDHQANVAVTISDDGLLIGGQSKDASGRLNAVVWRCT